LGIDGVTLSPAFNKDTLEYTAELAPETTKINVTAAIEDSKSSITGVGEIAVVDGSNRIEIKVTAENGSVKTYIINATVKEYNPIEVKINDKTYTVVRKKSLLTAPNNYTETTVTINNEEIPAFISDITKYTLVTLKDSDGNVNYYIYDSTANTYTLYQELSFNRVLLYPIKLDDKNIPSYYKATTITYNDTEVLAYKIKTSSRFALLYGMNIETGKASYYLYDTEEDTLQQYNIEEINILNNQSDLYFIIIMVLSALTFFFISGSIVLLIKKLKVKKDTKQSGLSQDTYFKKIREDENKK
ncbi:MAG: cadherin-like beta sandwich domain-containing protein, partial [Bacilli bacterium]